MSKLSAKHQKTFSNLNISYFDRLENKIGWRRVSHEFSPMVLQRLLYTHLQTYVGAHQQRNIMVPNYEIWISFEGQKDVRDRVTWTKTISKL